MGAVSPDQSEATASAARIDRSLVSGIAWTGALRWSGQVFSWASTLILARLLTPNDYGVFGISSVALSLLTMIAEFGIGSAVIVMRDLTEEQLAQINGLSVLFGGTVCLAACALAWPVGQFFGNPAMGPVFAALSLNLLILSARCVPWALLQRDLRFKRLAVMDSVQVVTVSGFNVLLAWLGFGYWTLVVGSILSALFSTGLALRYHPHRFAWPRMSVLRDTLPYMRNVVVQRIAWWVNSTSDMLIAGKFLGAQQAGAYSLAWTLSDAPLQKINEVVLRVTPGVLSAVQDDLAALRRYLLNLTQALTLVVFPVTIGVGLVADVFVPVVLGDKWLSSVGPLRVLSFYAAVRSLTPMLPQILNTRREAAFVARVNVAGAFLLPLGFYAGSRFGLTGLACAWLTVHPFLVAAFFRKTFRLIELRPLQYLSALVPALTGCAGMALCVLATEFTALRSLPPAAVLAGKVCAGAAGYGLVLILFHRATVNRLVNVLKSLRSPGTQ